MPEMSDLNSRANFQVLTRDGTPVVLYEDHRSLVYALWHAKRCGLLEVPHTLVTFDLHDDARSPASDVRERALSFRDGEGDEREFFSFVEWELGPNDDDWLPVAMDLNLVGDVVNIGAGHYSNLEDFETHFTDAAGQPHRAWRLRHLWDELAYQGALIDTARRETLNELWLALCWNPTSRRLHEDSRVILDFDLDCFSMTGPAGQLAWPDDVMGSLFARRSYQHERTAREVLLQLLERSPFVTIAKESPFCGGTNESQFILGSLDRVLFDGRLLSP